MLIPYIYFCCKHFNDLNNEPCLIYAFGEILSRIYELLRSFLTPRDSIVILRYLPLTDSQALFCFGILDVSDFNATETCSVGFYKKIVYKDLVILVFKTKQCTAREMRGCFFQKFSKIIKMFILYSE